MPHKFAIENVAKMSDEVFQGVLTLLPQLSTSASQPTYQEIERIVESRTTHLFIARRNSDSKIVGSLTLLVFRTPTGVRARIEDVVVDERHRGIGIGAELCRKAILCTTKAGAGTVDLTSHASREAANRLYLSVGFKLRETNVYRHTSQEF